MRFHYLMDLHYSQTKNILCMKVVSFTTLWIYTILKHSGINSSLYSVSLPYGFTLFSNVNLPNMEEILVSLPYGFTLFSNQTAAEDFIGSFHYLMDLHYSQTFTDGSEIKCRFTTLWIYTILKLLG